MNISYAVYPIQYCPRDLDGDVSDGTRVIAPKCVHSAHECTRKHTVTIWVSSNKKNRELHSNCFGSGLDFNFTVIFCRGALTSPSKCPKNIPAKILEECVQVLKGVRSWYILAFGFCLISRLPRIWCEGTQMDALFISHSFGACNMFIFLFISRNFHAAHFHQGVTSFLVFGVQPGVIKSIQEGVLANCQFLDGMKILHTNHFFSFLFFFLKFSNPSHMANLHIFNLDEQWRANTFPNAPRLYGCHFHPENC